MFVQFMTIVGTAYFVAILEIFLQAYKATKRRGVGEGIVIFLLYTAILVVATYALNHYFIIPTFFPLWQ